jgi:hypothetical protein
VIGYDLMIVLKIKHNYKGLLIIEFVNIRSLNMKICLGLNVQDVAENLPLHCNRCVTIKLYNFLTNKITSQRSDLSNNPW